MVNNLNIILRLLPSLERVVVRPSCTLTLPERHMEDDDTPFELAESKIRQWLSFIQPDVKVEIKFVLEIRLFSSWEREDFNIVQISETWAQDQHPANKIIFEGRLSTGCHTWNGLEMMCLLVGDGNTFGVCWRTLKHRRLLTLSSFYRHGFIEKDNR